MKTRQRFIVVIFYAILFVISGSLAVPFYTDWKFPFIEYDNSNGAYIDGIIFILFTIYFAYRMWTNLTLLLKKQ